MLREREEVDCSRLRVPLHQGREVRDVHRPALRFRQAQQGVRLGARALLQHHGGNKNNGLLVESSILKLTVIVVGGAAPEHAAAAEGAHRVQVAAALRGGRGQGGAVPAAADGMDCTIHTGWTKKKCVLKKRKSAMVGSF